MIEAFFRYQFLQNALIGGILSSIVCGIIGEIIVEKKMLMVSGGIAHTAYGGVGLGYLLGFEPLLGAIGFSLISAFGIGLARKKGGRNADILVALFWSVGMALGILFVSFMDFYPPDLSSYLFGDLLNVTSSDILLMSILTGIIVLVFIMFYQNWKLFLFDEELFSIRINARWMNYLLLCLIALSVVVLIRTSGIILVIALLSAPAATAGLFCKSLAGRMILAICFGILYSVLGLFLSFAFNFPAGASIVLISAIIYFTCLGLKSLYAYKS